MVARAPHRAFVRYTQLHHIYQSFAIALLPSHLIQILSPGTSKLWTFEMQTWKLCFLVVSLHQNQVRNTFSSWGFSPSHGTELWVKSGKSSFSWSQNPPINLHLTNPIRLKQIISVQIPERLWTPQKPSQFG